jgi:hypothetical protein
MKQTAMAEAHKLKRYFFVIVLFFCGFDEAAKIDYFSKRLAKAIFFLSLQALTTNLFTTH